MADIKDLLNSNKVTSFVRKGKSRPWTEDQTVTNEKVFEAKPGPNRGQTEAEPETELRPNRGQFEAIKELIRGQTEAKPGTEPRPAPRPIRGQSEAKSGTKSRPNLSVSSLDGLQRQIVFLIHSHCKRIRSEFSPPIAIDHIIETCGTTYHAARKAIQRLEQKGIVLRAEFKSGRSGWTKYELPNDVFQEMMQNEFEAKPRPIRGQTEGKLGTEVETEPRPKLSSSSGSNLDLKTTKTSERDSALPPEWLAIDVTQLLSIGFTQTHVRQLHRAGLLNPEEVQDSIHAFAFDLEVNGKAKSLIGPPLNFFMGCLRRGPYAPPENYEAPEDRQRRLYLEAKEKQVKARRELEDKIEALEFDEWSGKLTPTERTECVPPTDFARSGSTAHNVELRRYFRETIWPERKNKVVETEGLEK